MKQIKKITLLLALLSLLTTIVTINQTYAKYQTNIGGSANIKVARWYILVNNQDIINNSSSKIQITPTLEGSTHIKKDVIAPTSEGYFDLIIDAKDVDVSFAYNIQITTAKESNVKDYIAHSYTKNQGQIEPLTNNTITGNIYEKDSTKIINIRVYTKWNEDENSTMDNKEDTKATIEGSNNAILDVKLNFKQIT